MRVIGAGLPRTGTSSLRDGLGLLLGGRVHHMSEALRDVELLPRWIAALDRPDEADPRLLDGYVGAVDVPAALLWGPLATAFPDAIVLLSEREDAATWHRSMCATVLPRTRQMLARPEDPASGLFARLFRDLVDDPAELEDPAVAARAYGRWNDAVRAQAPADRLLVWRPSDGWEPLCEALGLPVPDVAFPHANSIADYHARGVARAERDRARGGRAVDDPRPR